jgi:integrase
MPRGSIRKRGQTWTVVVDTGRDPTTNRRRQQSKGGFATRQEATRHLTDTLARLDGGTWVKPTRELTGTYLLGWLAAIRASKKPTTYESYKRVVRHHLLPHLGHVPLQQLGPGHLSAAFADMSTSGRRDGKGGLSPRMVRYAHAVLRRALGDAVKEGTLARNVAALEVVRERLPKQRRHGYRTWTAAELARFLHYTEGDPLHPVFTLAATSGMRRGEVCGVRWRDLDLDGGRLSVRQTVLALRDVDADVGRRQTAFGGPKTDRERVVSLPASTVAVLRAHRKRQLEERLLVGEAYHDQDLVFAAPDGGPIHPEHLAKWFRTRARQAGVPQIRFHDLRHTWATLALQAGVHPKVVSEQLGHATVSITLNVYSHVLPGMSESAVEHVAALVSAAGDQMVSIGTRQLGRQAADLQ